MANRKAKTRRSNTKRRNQYSKNIGKTGRTIKRKLYSYYKKLVRTLNQKKKGG